MMPPQDFYSEVSDNNKTINDVCTKYQKKFFPILRDMNIYTNIMYFIPAIIAISYSYSKHNKMAIKDRCNKECLKQVHILGVMGIIVTIVSTIHHVYNVVDLNCKEYVKPTLFRMLGDHLDVLCANLSVLYGFYLVYKRKKFNKVFFISLVLINIFALILFFYSEYVHREIKKIKNKNSQDFITGLSIYSFYHAYWHVFSGFSFVLIVYYLTN